MSTLLHSQRPRSGHTLAGRSFCKLASLLLVSLVVFAGNNARAVVTYSYSGSHQLTWNTNSSKTITINRTGGYTALVACAVVMGSSNFSVSPYAVYWPDSSMDTAYKFPRYFSVQFASSKADTSTGFLVLYDSAHTHSDTIALTGYGTQDTRDFRVADTSMWFNVIRDSMGTFAFATDIVYSLQSSGITVFAGLDDSTHFDLDGHGGSELLSIAGSGNRTFQVNYTPHGVYHDQTTVHLVCGSPYSQKRDIIVYVTDPLYAPTYYIPTVTAPGLGVVAPGDTGCGLVVIENTTKQPITITYISTDSVRWTANKPSVPFTIQPGNKVTFNVCFVPGAHEYGTYSTDGIRVSYSDPNGLTGSVSAGAWARTPSCIEGLNDTLQFDDVIAGGYVDALVPVVVHLDSMLTESYHSIWPSGGTVSVVSPSLPMHVHAGDTVLLRLRVTPQNDTSGTYWGYISFAGGGGCGATLSFFGNVTKTGTSNLQLFPAQTELIAMRTTQKVTVDTFWFVNNTSTDVHVTGASLAHGAPYFAINGYLPHSLPDTLTPSQKFGVIVQFNGDTLGFYHDSLTIQASQSLMSQVYNLEAVLLKSAGAGVNLSIAPVQATLSLVPNPAQGEISIAIAGAPRATIELYDLLGNRVATLANVSQTTYDPSALAGGIYIVRATGTDDAGNAFTISKRLAIVK